MVGTEKKIRSHIRPLSGEDAEFVYETIDAHPEYYGKCYPQDFMHSHFYGVYDDNNKLLAFFALCNWGYMTECVLACVFVREEYRRKGIFKKIVHYAINKACEYAVITIGAERENEIANKIYKKMFTFSNYNEEVDGNFYVIKDRRVL